MNNKYNDFEVEKLVIEYKKNGSKEIRDKIISSCFPIAKLYADIYYRKSDNGKEGAFLYEDILIYGYYALWDALEDFDTKFKKSKFKAYAKWRIKNYMMNAMKDFKSLIREPRSFYEKRRKFIKILQNPGKYNVDIENDEQIARYIGEIPENIKFYRNIQNFASLEKEKYENNSDDDTTLGDLIEDKKNDVEKDMILSFLREDLKNALSVLEKRERQILKRRLEGYTLEDIGEDFGINRERIRQLESEAKRKMKLRFNELKNYLPVLD